MRELVAVVSLAVLLSSASTAQQRTLPSQNDLPAAPINDAELFPAPAHQDGAATDYIYDYGQARQSLRMEAAHYGQYAVGFRSEIIHDFTRPPLLGEAGTARSLVINLWYPAKTVKNPMTPADYLANSYQEIAAGKKSTRDQIVQEWTRRLGFTGKETVPATSILQSETAAGDKAEGIVEIKGIILYSPGAGEEGSDNFLLCEVLASHGYVVAASPSVGFLQAKSTPTAKNLETAARDLETVLGYVRASSAVANKANVALMGYSWGGLAAMLVQMRNPAVIGVASLDGSIASHQDKAQQTAWFDISAMRVPYLIYSASDTLEKHVRFLDKVRYAPVTHVHLGKMNHSDFQSFRYVLSKFRGEADNSADIRVGYETIVNQTSAFFDWCFSRNARELSAFAPDPISETGNYSVTTRAALAPPPSEAEFFALVRREGAAKGRTIFDEFRSHDPELTMFDIQGLAEVGFEVFDAGKQNEGIEVLKLLVDAFPHDYKPHGYLGSLYQDSGDAQSALSQYGIALGMALNDTHEDPMQRQNDVTLFRGLLDKVRKTQQPN